MDKQRSDLFSIGVVLVVAVIFFSLGATSMAFFGPHFLKTTSVVYTDEKQVVEISTTTTPTTATSEVSTTGSIHSTDPVSSVTESTTTIVRRKIMLNSATKEELMMVPGIGEAFATRIIEYRELIGGFTSIEQLKNVDGIGEKRYAQWSTYFEL